MRTIVFIADEAQAGRSAASVLRREMRLSGGLIARLKLVPGGLTRNGLPLKTNELIAAGDVLSAAVGESPADEDRAPLPFPVLFEDEDILVIDKPAGAAVHGSRYDDTVPSVESDVNAYYGKEGLFHPVSRLDRGTTGVMLIAKNGFMHELLALQLHTNAFKRYYLGAAEGIFSEAEGTISLPIARIEGSAIKREIREDGAPSVTHYRVIWDKHVGRPVSLVEFLLETGRTHQIRLHTAAVGHPLVGDWLYGTEDRERIARPALHSARLIFTHPLTGQRQELCSPLPNDMLALFEAE